jgi:hypothetical protein
LSVLMSHVPLCVCMRIVACTHPLNRIRIETHNDDVYIEAALLVASHSLDNRTVMLTFLRIYLRVKLRLYSHGRRSLFLFLQV